MATLYVIVSSKVGEQFVVHLCALMREHSTQENHSCEGEGAGPTYPRSVSVVVVTLVGWSAEASGSYRWGHLVAVAVCERGCKRE